uniref:Ribosomal protein S11 n=1 Tax=Dracocephalum moldavica TaxID=39296 RepID=A0A891ZRT4_DRAMO|nr:ribosomal protein S11 [Dracocephalum moldavica]QRN74232.1 ribosomal protein S11 [Dracocephalum moldavica]
MAKAIPRTGLCRNVHIGAHKIPKGVIHVQASFNNTIVTVTNVRGRVVSWPVLVDSRGREEEQLKMQQQMLLVQ